MSEKISLDDRKNLSASGVKEVKSSDSREIRLALTDGTGVLIMGENLKINSFSKDSGELSLSGEILSFRYSRKKEQFFKRVFK